MSDRDTQAISIYGSCVSRDTVDFCGSEQIPLKRYIARQSLISAYSPAPSLTLDLSALTSKFQRRMVDGDLERSLPTALPLIAADSRLLVWDLVDERHGVYELEGGTFVTRSLELIHSGADETLQKIARHVPFGTDEHFTLWKQALSAFILDLDRHELRDRVRLIDVPWALKDTEGDPIPPSMGVDTKKANKSYQRYFAMAEPFVTTFRIGRAVKPRGSAQHRWGLAPFHYDDDVYAEIASALGLPTAEASH